MKSIFIVLILLTLKTFAFVDNDLDGVDDSIDRCPNSKITELVDRFGCKVKELKIKESVNVDIYFGYTKSYYEADKDESIDSSLTISYKNYSFYLSDSKYNSSSSHYGTIALYYKNSFNNIYYKFGIGANLSSDESKTSYFFSSKLTYIKNSFDISLKYKRYFNQNLTDTNFYELCLGYSLNNFYLYNSLSYETKLSSDLNSNKLYAIGGSYYFDSGYYINIEYSKALGESSFRALSFGLGYSF